MDESTPKSGSKKEARRRPDAERRALERRMAEMRRADDRRRGTVGQNQSVDERRHTQNRRQSDDRRMTLTRRTGVHRRAGYDREAGIRRLCIDTETRKTLVDFRHLLAEHIDEILDDFQSQVMTPQGGSGAVRVCAEQRRRWLEDICGGKFRGADIRRGSRAARARYRPGIDSPWFMACYCFVLNRAVELANEAFAGDTEKMASVVKALHQAVFLDLDLSMFMHTQALEGQGPWYGALSQEEITALLNGR